MQLTGLEASLLGGAIATVTGLVCVVAAQYINTRRNQKYIDKDTCVARVNHCNERFERGDKKMDQTKSELQKLTKMFERSIIYSNLPADVKAKIINGDGS